MKDFTTTTHLAGVNTYPQPCDVTPENIRRAAVLLKAGKLVAFPTETVYGLGADARNEQAVAQVFNVKRRPDFNPLIVHVADITMAERYGQFHDTAHVLANAFWPGPLTLVLKRTSHPFSLLASAGMDTIALRIPGHEAARALIQEVGHGLVAPSANLSGKVSPTRAAHVVEELGDSVAMILDAGPCRVGIESTVIDLSEEIPVLLRPGAIVREEIEAHIGPIEMMNEHSKMRGPGMLKSHYAPSLPVRLNVRDPKPDEALLAFGAAKGGALNLSERGDLTEAAANLFAALRELDKPEQYCAIAVMPVPEEGIGIAINDRLRRAAADR